MRVALVGFDTEGRVSYEYYKRLGADITVCDQKTDLIVPEGADTQLGERYLDDLDRFDVIVRTAGMPRHIILDANPGIGAKLTTHVDEFLRVCPTPNVIGVTGTKGKGTTSTLITRMVEATGRTVRLGGNIGVPPLGFLGELDADSWVVLELSSFQLSDITRSPHIGVCLMVVPEHLNWHADMADYKNAKSHMFEFQSSDDLAIYFSDSPDSTEIASSGAARKLPYYRSPGAWVNGNMITIDGAEICTTDELKLLGKHNWQNVCAALTAYWQVDQDVDAARSVLTTFSGLEHRLELVRELEEVLYYDDSFGTTPETAIVAMQAFRQPKIVILGGSDKGAQYDELAKAVAKNSVKKALLIGDQAERIRLSLDTVGYTNYELGGVTMEQIVAKARVQAEPGDVVLLSTGCASFGMFNDYKDRGNQFKQQVLALA